MSSRALQELLAGVDEVRALRSLYPSRVSRLGLTYALAAKAHGRACTVLLCSHFERYLYGVNEEAIDWMNAGRLNVALLPVELLLQHSRAPIDDLARTDWLNREAQLRAFVLSDGGLWTLPNGASALDHSQLLTWMKTPKPEDLMRFYRQFGIKNIFVSITRSSSIRGKLILSLKELAEKRNNIAHGDVTTEALKTDVTRYLASVSKFAASADWVFSRRLRSMMKASSQPW